MSFEEFKKITFHTRTYLRIPGLNLWIDKQQNLMTKGKYDFKKEDKLLKKIYEEHKSKLEKF